MAYYYLSKKIQDFCFVFKHKIIKEYFSVYLKVPKNIEMYLLQPTLLLAFVINLGYLGYSQGILENPLIIQYNVLNLNITTDNRTVEKGTALFVDDEDDNFSRPIRPWIIKKRKKGYEILSDESVIRTKLLKRRKELKIVIKTGSARTVEMKRERRVIDIKIFSWDKINRVKVTVPYGVLAEEIKVVEKALSIQLYCPYGFLEFVGET